MSTLTRSRGQGRAAGGRCCCRRCAPGPGSTTLRTLRQRFREDRLGLTAGSLTFTTLIALVPLVTVMLAVFTAFPMFSSFQGALESYFLQSLVPDNIARPVLRALTQFAGKARGWARLGLVLLVVTALALMLTIDRTLNAIWRVRRPRPIAQRVLVYWAALTLGPLVLGLSLSLTSLCAVGAARAASTAMPGNVAFALNALQFVLLAAGMAALFHYVPNISVRWRHAWAGGMFVAVAFEGAKRALVWYVNSVPSYSTVYGAFATVPILLLWIYLGWVDRAAGRGDRRLCAQPADARGDHRAHRRLAFRTGADRCCASSVRRGTPAGTACRWPPWPSRCAPIRCSWSRWSNCWPNWTGCRAWTKAARLGTCCCAIRRSRRWRR